MELTKLTTMTLENQNIRLVGYDENDDVILMHDIDSESMENIISAVKECKETDRVEFIFSRSLEIKVFSEDENRYPYLIYSEGVSLKPNSNYYKYPLMFKSYKCGDYKTSVA